MRDASTTVVTDDGEAVVAERAHDRDLVGRHAAFRIGCVMLPAVWLRAVAMTAQVRCDHAEALGKARRDLAPGNMRLRVAVQQQHRRPMARGGGADRDAVTHVDVV